MSNKKFTLKDLISWALDQEDAEYFLENDPDLDFDSLPDNVGDALDQFHEAKDVVLISILRYAILAEKLSQIGEELQELEHQAKHAREHSQTNEEGIH